MTSQSTTVNVMGWFARLERFPLRRSNSVAAMSGVVRAFVWGEEAECGGDQIADLLKVSRTRGAQERLQFSEGEFDRVEVGTVGREEAERRARLLDGDPDVGLLMYGKIVEHDDIPRPQRGDQHLFDIGEETRTINRAIEHGGRVHSFEPKRGDDRVRLPMTAGRMVAEPRAARTPAVAP